MCQVHTATKVCTVLYSTIWRVKSIQYSTAQYNASSLYSTVELPMALYIFHTNWYYLWKLYHIHSTRRTQTNQSRMNQSKMITTSSPSWTETLVFVEYPVLNKMLACVMEKEQHSHAMACPFTKHYVKFCTMVFVNFDLLESTVQVAIYFFNFLTV